ncbi:MAG: glycosyltransferase [Planctomycetes bacterium]|nr:glycosyltransferase [Planctomycetota bacterium]
MAPLSKLRLGKDLGVLRWIFEFGRHAVFRLLDGIARAALAMLGSGASPRPPGKEPRAGGPIAFVLPVLPDLSHTFVYREVEAILALAPDALVVVLEHGTTRVVHPEAARLLPRARYVPARGVVARACGLFVRFATSPRRVRALAALYRDGPGGAAAALLGKLPLREARHPGRAFELAALLAPLRPAQIHVYGSTWSANVALGAAVLLDVPLSISSYVDFEFDYAHKLLATKFEHARFFRVCTRDCRRRLARMLAREDLATNDIRVPILHWGIDAARLRARSPAPPPRLARENLRLISACRVVRKKGLHLVPPLLAALVRDGIDARWTLAGDGPELARVKSLAHEHGVEARCTFAGPLPNDALLAAIESNDIALLPCVETDDGERDGIPVFLIEAMALGRCVVSTCVSGIPELIEDGANGWLASAEPGALAARIGSILADPVAARAIAEHGRDSALATEDSAASAAALLTRLRAAP